MLSPPRCANGCANVITKTDTSRLTHPAPCQEVEHILGHLSSRALRPTLGVCLARADCAARWRASSEQWDRTDHPRWAWRGVCVCLQQTLCCVVSVFFFSKCCNQIRRDTAKNNKNACASIKYSNMKRETNSIKVSSWAIRDCTINQQKFTPQHRSSWPFWWKWWRMAKPRIGTTGVPPAQEAQFDLVWWLSELFSLCATFLRSHQWVGWWCVKERECCVFSL